MIIWRQISLLFFLFSALNAAPLSSLVAQRSLSLFLQLAAVTDYSRAQVAPLESIARVRYSLDAVQESIASSSDAGLVVTQIKTLLSNYRLKANCAAALEIVPQERKEEARKHADTAVEDLVQIYEYFPDDIDNQSGTKRPPREVLQFADRAVAAAKVELNELFRLVPSDISQEVLKNIAAEFVTSQDKPTTTSS